MYIDNKHSISRKTKLKPYKTTLKPRVLSETTRTGGRSLNEGTENKKEEY